MSKLLLLKEHSQAHDAYQKLHKCSIDGRMQFPNLEALRHVFKPICDVQKRMHLLLPTLCALEGQLLAVKSGIQISGRTEVPLPFEKKLASACLDELRKIPINEMWVLFHPVQVSAILVRLLVS